jgi:uncharacterized protein (TIGR03437 family)
MNSKILSHYTPPNSSICTGISISAHAGQGGIVLLISANDSADGVPATLHALNADNIEDELWNSDINSARDQPGSFVKFANPTVANGRVYVPTLSNAVAVYGSLSSPPGTASPAISSIANSASNLEGAVAPGELVTIYGANLGPPLEALAELNGDFVDDTVEGTQVMIGGVAAPVLYASPTQINTVVPFGVAGTSAQLQVVYHGQATATASMGLQAASPAVFSMNGDGGGQGAILNQDGSVNSRSNPASRGTVVSLFATGAGITSPPSVDGFVTTAPYPVPTQPVSVTIEGEPANVIYAGAAPGLVAGVLQINVIIPADALQEPYDQVVITVGDFVSPSAVTVAVQ